MSTNTDPRTITAAARKYVNDDLIECAKDFRTLKNTGILPRGCFADLIDIIRPLGLDDSMKIAESILVEAMLDEIADR
jgi:hypothetical protein